MLGALRNAENPDGMSLRCNLSVISHQYINRQLTSLNKSAPPRSESVDESSKTRLLGSRLCLALGCSRVSQTGFRGFVACSCHRSVTLISVLWRWHTTCVVPLYATSVHESRGIFMPYTYLGTVFVIVATYYYLGRYVARSAEDIGNHADLTEGGLILLDTHSPRLGTRPAYCLAGF
jgi:hypothetical protein